MERGEPSASRMPISRVRWAVAYANAVDADPGERARECAECGGQDRNGALVPKQVVHLGVHGAQCDYRERGVDLPDSPGRGCQRARWCTIGTDIEEHPARLFRLLQRRIHRRLDRVLDARMLYVPDDADDLDVRPNVVAPSDADALADAPHRAPATEALREAPVDHGDPRVADRVVWSQAAPGCERNAQGREETGRHRGPFRLDLLVGSRRET